MFQTPVHSRVPRGGVDPINDADTAFMAISLAVHRPFRHETIVAQLDCARRGIALIVVSGTNQPSDVVAVFECLAQPSHVVSSLIVASVRPSGFVDDHDIDKWLDMSEIATTAGLELLEWFVIGTEVTCPRDLLGESPRW